MYKFYIIYSLKLNENKISIILVFSVKILYDFLKFIVLMFFHVENSQKFLFFTLKHNASYNFFLIKIIKNKDGILGSS